MPKLRKKLVTAALPYANGPLHLGHILEQIQADVWVRAQKMMGHEVFFICGEDAHGTPIMLKAEQAGITPEALIARVEQSHRTDLKEFEIHHDNYGSTHSPENQALVNEIYAALLKNGDIIKKTIQQAYDPIKQIFLPDRYVKGGCPRCKTPDQYGDNCEQCGASYSPSDLIDPKSTLTGATPEWRASEHFFFDLPRHQAFLKSWATARVLSEAIVHKLNEWLDHKLEAWDISRDKPYFGFEIPGAPGKYFYVWLDAPVGYMASFMQFNKELFDEFWRGSTTDLYHFVGKDIVYFHALFWPCLLNAAGFRLPTKIFTHGYLTVDGQKMSKSRGTFILARTYLNHLDPAYLRYYFCAKLSPDISDIDFNLSDFMTRVNADLIGKVVNIASRCSAFIEKYFDLKLASGNPDLARWTQALAQGETIFAHYEHLEFSKAVREIMALADHTNQYIDAHKPWVMIKNERQQQDVQAVCSFCLNMFKLLVTYLKPILPRLAEQTESFLNSPPLTFVNRGEYLVNHAIRPYQPLLTRIDDTRINAMKEEAQAQAPINAAAPLAATFKPEISYDEFDKVDLRIARIIKAEGVPDADKLIKLTVEIGGVTRQIFAGIKSAYTPEQLEGRLTVVVANLAPRKMRFGVSEGMVLAAGPGGKEIWILSPDEGAGAGMKVK